MMTGSQQLCHYRSEVSKIQEARQIFFDKGVIRRELIANELAFSWLRCKYKNVDPLLEPIHKSADVSTASCEMMVDDLAQLSDIWVGLFDEKGNLLRYTGNLSLCQQFSKWSFDEALAGYNGIGNCLENHIRSIIIGYEHYHEALCSVISVGIPFGQQTVGLILPLSAMEADHLDAYLEMPFQEIFSAMRVKDSTYPLSCHFFRKDIDVFSNCFEAFSDISEKTNCLMVTGAYSCDGYQLANAIHMNSSRAELPFVYISDKLPTNLIEALLDKASLQGTFYVEAFRWLPRRLQQKIVKLICCKSINSKAHSGLYKSDIAVIIFENTQVESPVDLLALYADLQEALGAFQLCIPSFQDIGVQFKPYLFSEFEKICVNQGIYSLSFDEAVFNLLTQYHWPRGYSEIEWLADFHLDHAENPLHVTMESIPEYIKCAMLRTSEVPSLKDKEREWIASVLNLCKGNIKQSAKHLGITRTTLYKKIEEYQIEV